MKLSLSSILDAAALLWFELVGVAVRGIVLAASIVNGTPPRGLLR